MLRIPSLSPCPFTLSSVVITLSVLATFHSFASQHHIPYSTSASRSWSCHSLTASLKFIVERFVLSPGYLHQEALWIRPCDHKDRLSIREHTWFKFLQKKIWKGAASDNQIENSNWIWDSHKASRVIRRIEIALGEQVDQSKIIRCLM